MLSNKKICLLTFLFFFSSILISQTTKYSFEALNTTHGIPMNSVTAIEQDHLGFMWFGTGSGLVRYDGYSFKSIKDTSTLSKLLEIEHILFIKQDSQNNIWIGTVTSGLIKYNYTENKLSKVIVKDADHNIVFDEIAMSVTFHHNNVWISSYSQGLLCISLTDNELLELHKNVDKESDKTILFKKTFFDETGKMWIGCENGLYIREENGVFTNVGENYYNELSYKNNYVNSFFIDSENILWINFYNRGIIKVDLTNKKWENLRGKHEEYDKIPSATITDIIETDDGDIWFSNMVYGVIRLVKSENKIIRYKRERKTKNPFESHSSYDLFIDRDGLLWVGSMTHGVYKLDKYKEKFSHLINDVNDKNSLSGGNVWAMDEDIDGTIWITSESGITQWDKKNNIFHRHLKNYDLNIPMYRYHSTSVLAESEKVWFGTVGEGLYEFDKKTTNFKIHRGDPKNPNSMQTGQIGSIIRDGDNLWCSFLANQGLCKFNQKENKYTRYYHTDDTTSITTNRIAEIILRKNNEIWIANYKGGLNKYNRETDTFAKYFIDSKELDMIITIYEDSRNQLWVGTNHSGLYLFNDSTKTFTSYKNPEGNNLNSIKSIIEDDFGDLWIGTDAGVSKLNLKNNTFTNFSAEEGFKGDFTIFRSITKDRDGKIYFGSPEGINIIDPSNLIINKKAPEVIITNLILHNSQISKDLLNTSKVELNYDENNITIKMMIPQYSRTKKNRYYFKFSNEKKWFDLKNENSLTLHNLEPGEYNLQFMAKNSDGIKSKKLTNFNIYVLPPFYRSIFFQVMVGIIILSILIVVYKKRITFIEKRKTELEERVKERTKAAEKLSIALNEVDELKNKLVEENTYLQSEINLDHNFSDFICKAESLKRVLQKVEQVAASDTTVLVLGETGTGKELIARSLHNLSDRRERALVKVNCAALPETLIESELFGHEKGAFTGAVSLKRGRFELADGGTIFLDEIGELPLALQTKLLRVLQEGEFERVGGTKTLKVDVRVIAATNRKLKQEVSQGTFREDLFFRLNVFPIEIPPLKDRKEDIPILVNHFVKKYENKIGKKISKIPNSLIDKLIKYNWPGNIRELENVIERALILSPGEKLILDDSFISENTPEILNDQNSMELQEVERNHIIKVLEKTNWQVSGENGAAKLLNIKAPTLVSRMKKLGIENPYKPKSNYTD